MKAVYESPKMDVIVFETEDIITTSATPGGNPDELDVMTGNGA